VKSQKARKFVLAILTFSRVIGPGASAKAVLWKTSGQKGGAGGGEDRKSLFSQITYVQIKCGVGNAECGVNGNGKGNDNGNDNGKT
jgi:hypothetical protein